MREKALNAKGKYTWCTMPKHLRGTRRCNHIPEGTPLNQNGVVPRSDLESEENKELMKEMLHLGEDLEIPGNLIRIFKKSEHPEFMIGKNLDGEDEDIEIVAGNWETIDGNEDYAIQYLPTLPGIKPLSKDKDYNLQQFFNGSSKLEENMEDYPDNKATAEELKRESERVAKEFMKSLNKAAGKDLEWENLYDSLCIDLRANDGYGIAALAYDKDTGVLYQNCFDVQTEQETEKPILKFVNKNLDKSIEL